jgi:hypothetical protein
MSRCWRVRLKDGALRDRTQEAWDRDEIGIWYGAWSAQDWTKAAQSATAAEQIAEHLNQLSEQQSLGWKVSINMTNTAKRFHEISEDDWIVVYLQSTQEIGLAKVSGPAWSDSDYPLNELGEVFKRRAIVNKKRFKLIELPDAYRLVPTQGRGNVHQFNSMMKHVRLLAEHATSADVNAAFRALPFDDLLECLGASAWESFALAYLILESGFVPTGLSTGRTLPIVDIVGRSRTEGSRRIVAQCKKNSDPQQIDPDFIALSRTLSSGDSAYYFAYGGCRGDLPKNIKIIDRDQARHWVTTDRGRLYWEMILQD